MFVWLRPDKNYKCVYQSVIAILERKEYQVPPHQNWYGWNVLRHEREFVTVMASCSMREQKRALAEKYTSFEELTPTLMNTFIEKILVHEVEVDADGQKQ